MTELDVRGAELQMLLLAARHGPDAAARADAAQQRCTAWLSTALVVVAMALAVYDVALVALAP